MNASMPCMARNKDRESPTVERYACCSSIRVAKELESGFRLPPGLRTWAQAEQALTVKEEGWLQFLRTRKIALFTGCLSHSWKLCTSPIDPCKLHLMRPFWSSVLSPELWLLRAMA